jgi:hypothetical protein
LHGVDRGIKWYRARVANVASAVHTYHKYKEHGHQFVKGINKEFERTGHQINKAEIEGRREAIVYHTDRRVEDWQKEHSGLAFDNGMTNKNSTKIRAIRTNAIRKREKEITDEKKAKLKAAAELKAKRLREAKIRKEKLLQAKILRREKAAEKARVVKRKVKNPVKSEWGKVWTAAENQSRIIFGPKPKVKKAQKSEWSKVQKAESREAKAVFKPKARVKKSNKQAFWWILDSRCLVTSLVILDYIFFEVYKGIRVSER